MTSTNPPTPLGPNTDPTTDPGWTQALDRLRTQVAGPVLAGTDDGAADEVAGFNLAVRQQPTVVVGATCTDDVAAAVRWAADQGLAVAVQASGHGAVRPVRDCLLVTTHRMASVAVDPVAATATVTAGTQWDQVVEATAPHGLSPLLGSTQLVGAVGYTIGGGLGLFSRKHGFAADLVLSLEVVTADGEVRHVDADHEPDLFWAVRGGKGSFGIVTSMTMRLLPFADFWGGPVFFHADDTRAVLHAYRTWADTLPEDATTSVSLLRVPDLPDVPEPVRGRFVVHLRYSHCGDPAEAEQLVQPMLGAGQVLLSHLGPVPVAASDLVHMDPRGPLPAYDHGAMLRELAPETIDALVDAAGPHHDLPVVLVELRQLGGALARPSAAPNAVAGRDGAYSVLVIGAMAPGLEEVTPGVTAGIVGSLGPWLTDGALVNFLGGANATPEQVGRAWTPDVLERLLAVKDAYDPDNRFRFGHALR
jgi:hypothetical protein